MAEDVKLPDSVDLHVGEMIRRRRKFLKLGQEDLAAVLDLTKQQVQKYETAQSRVSASKLFKIARVLKVPVAYFFAEIDELGSGNLPDAFVPSVSAFLKTSDGQKLASLFPQIEDDAVRKSFLNLARAMVKASQAGKLVD